MSGACQTSRQFPIAICCLKIQNTWQQTNFFKEIKKKVGHRDVSGLFTSSI